MPRWIASAFFLVAMVAVAAAQPVTPERKQKSDEAFKARMAYATSKEYNPYSDAPGKALQEANQHLEKQEFKEAIASADLGLKADPFSIGLLQAKSIAHRELKEEAQADKFRAEWFAIVDSILDRGDGRSFRTAFQVISVAEEYAVLSLIGMRRDRQALVTDGGSQFDVFEVTHAQSGTKLTLHFNVDAPLKSLQAKLTPAVPAAPAAKK